LIGSALVERLTLRHRVLLGVRSVGKARQRWPQGEIAEIDLSDAGVLARGPAVLEGADALINTIGIFREQGSQTFDAVHVKGPLVIFQAAARCGVRHIIQISALGAAPDALTAYLSSKHRADAALLQLPVRPTIVKPSLVFSPAGASTRWFAMLAALPLTPLPGDGRQLVQPVHLDDLCDAVVHLLEHSDPPVSLAAVGPEPISMKAYLTQLKRSLGFRGWLFPVPRMFAHAAAAVLSGSRRALLTRDSLLMLEAGNVADAAAFEAVLGRPARPPSRFVDPIQRRTMRDRAALDWLLPLLRYALAILWIGTGLVSLFAYPEIDSLALLARTGLEGILATLALYGAAALDLALGAALLVSRFRRVACAVQIGLVLTYTALISVFLPEYWAHPYGPVLKNLPLIAATLLLYELDGDGTADR